MGLAVDPARRRRAHLLGRERFADRAVAIKEYYPSSLAFRQSDGSGVVPTSERARADFQWGLERFRQEAKLLIGLKHPNIAPVLAYFEANGTGYLVMEFQEGRSLGDVLREGTQTEGSCLKSSSLCSRVFLRSTGKVSFIATLSRTTS